MALSIEMRMDEDFAVFELNGALTLGPFLVNVRNAAKEFLNKPKVCGLILDVNQVNTVDSSGLGELTIVYSSANRHNCPMCLVGVKPSLQKMLVMTHLDAVLTSAEDIPAAKKQLKRR